MNGNKIYKHSVLIFILIVLPVALFFRIPGLAQGFHDGDEYECYLILADHLPRYYLHGIDGSLLGRPISFLISYVFLELFGYSPAVLLSRSILAGIFLVCIIYYVGEKYLNKYAGLFASAISATTFTFVYYTKNMKSIVVELMFAALCLLVFFSLERNNTKNRYIMLGILVSFTFATQPNAFPFALMILFFAACLAFKQYFIDKQRHIYIQYSILSFSLVLFCCELFFILARYVFRHFYLDGDAQVANVGYLTMLLSGLTVAQIVEPSYKFYLKAFSFEGKLFYYCVLAASFIFPVICLYKKRYLLSILSLLFWGIISYWVFSDVIGLFRNVIIAFIPGILMIGAVLAIYYNRVERKLFSNVKIKLLFPILITVSLIISGGIVSKNLLLPMSAPQEIYDDILGAPAQLTKPSISVYHWIDYYFYDRDLLVNNWVEVFNKFIQGKSEYLVSLIQGETSFEPLGKYKQYKTFKQIVSSNDTVEYGYFHLRKQPEIFAKEFGVKYLNSLNLDNNLIWTKDKFFNEKSQNTITIPKNANFIVMHGNTTLDIAFNELIKLEIINEKLEIPLGERWFTSNSHGPLTQIYTKQKSLFSVWRIPNNLHIDKLKLIFSAYSNDLKKVNKRVEIKDFGIDFIEVPANKAIDFKKTTKLISNYKSFLFQPNKEYSPDLINETLKTVFPGEFFSGKHVEFNINDFPTYQWYKIKFKARTKFFGHGSGRLYVIADYGTKTEKTILVGNFWKPWPTTYEYKFIPPLFARKIGIFFDNGTGSQGKIKIYEIKMEKLD